MITFSFDPVWARFGPIEIGWHGFVSLVAVAAGLWIGLRGAQRIGVPSERLGSALTWGSIGAVVGARAFHVADHLAYYAAHPLEILAIAAGGIAVYGGFIGALAGGLLAAQRSGLPIRRLLDVAAPAMLVGQVIGRLGCLANGDAWGAPTGAAFGIVYAHPNARLPAELLGVPTHPYPLYEMAAVTALVSVLVLVRRSRALADGGLFVTAVLGYALVRSVLTSFRQETVVFSGLQEAQVVALATSIAAVVLALVWSVRLPRTVVIAR